MCIRDRSWIKAHTARAHGTAGTRGCLLIETTVEMGPHDALIAKRATAIFSAMLMRLELALAGARDADIKSPAATARALLASLEGLRILGKAGQSEGDVAGAVDVLAEQLLPARRAR